MRRPPARGLVRAKTGTTDNSSALSGFVGDRYVFSILENGSPVRTLSAEQSQNRFAQVLARAAAAARTARRAARAGRSSERIGTSAFCAFVSFEAPGSSPTTRPVVFAETESVTFAPSASSRAFASSREKRSSVPVMTYVLPVSGPSRGRSSSLASKRRPRLAQLLDERAVLVVREPVDDVLGAVGAEALDLGDLLGSRRDQPVDGAEVAREVAREHPADPGDVEAEEDARERHLLGALDRLDRRARGDLREALELDAAAPSSGGRDRAASGRGPSPTGCGSSARRRRRCRRPPSS